MQVKTCVVEASACLKPGGQRGAQQRCAQLDPVQRKAVDPDRDGQIGHAEPRGLRAWDARRGCRCAQHLQALGCQRIHIEPAAQQRGPVPVQHNALELQPQPRVVRDTQPLHLCLRGQRAGEPVNLDDAALCGQLPLQQRLDLGSLGVDQRGPAERGEYDARKPFQNACPMPMKMPKSLRGLPPTGRPISARIGPRAVR